MITEKQRGKGGESRAREARSDLRRQGQACLSSVSAWTATCVEGFQQVHSVMLDSIQKKQGLGLYSVGGLPTAKALGWTPSTTMPTGFGGLYLFIPGSRGRGKKRSSRSSSVIQQVQDQSRIHEVKLHIKNKQAKIEKEAHTCLMLDPTGCMAAV